MSRGTPGDAVDEVGGMARSHVIDLVEGMIIDRTTDGTPRSGGRDIWREWYAGHDRCCPVESKSGLVKRLNSRLPEHHLPHPSSTSLCDAIANRDIITVILENE